MRLRINDRRTIDKKRKALLDFARSYLSEAFPNPDREGCPSDVVLRSLASNPIEGQPAVTEHLAACSPCFRRYGELLDEFKRQPAKEKRFTRGAIAWTKAHPVLIGTAALCLLLIGIGVGFFLGGIRKPNTPPIDAHRNPSPTEPHNPTVAYSPFSLDLSALSPLRGPEPSTGTQQRVLVPNSPLDLTLTLPLASPEGPYDLKLTAESRTFWSKAAQAHLQNGKTLVEVDADFTQIQVGNYSLEVRSSTGIRFIQMVSIQNASPPSTEQKQ